ncbi:MAG: metallothionein [Gammaproteobacteria bacterium]|nr:metallothionein [Gammaproteobacteria bacterium]
MKATQGSESITQVKCAHPACQCLISVAAAVVSGGRFYCVADCAQGHGCGHVDCDCAGLHAGTTDSPPG